MKSESKGSVFLAFKLKQAHFASKNFGSCFHGADEIIDRLTYVCENHEGKYIAHLAEITGHAQPGRHEVHRHGR